MKKRILAVLLSAMMVFTYMPLTVLAETAVGDDNDAETLSEIASQVQDPSNDPFDYTTRSTVLRSRGKGNYPESYDLRDDGLVTPVKFQNPFGTCWGFAAIAAAETSILGSDDPAVRGDYTADNLNLSEKHLVYFVGQAIKDPDNPQYGEGTHADKDVSVSDQLNGGGQTFLATNLFASGIGPVIEDDGTAEYTMQYKGAEESIEYRLIDGKMTEYCYDDEDDWSLPEEWRFLHSFVLKESYMLPSPAHTDHEAGEYEYNPDGTEAIKEMLLNKRAVQIAFCADTSMPSQEAGDGLYISKNWAHYTYDAAEYANHAVTIVGWDDNYPKENFVEGHNPPWDGAWLVKNSWGSQEEQFPNRGPGWGIENEKGENTGYFWLSYYDKTLETPEALEFDINEGASNEGDYIDEHDFMPPDDVEGAATDGETKMSNVFKARECELLDGVSCQTTYPGTKVINEVYLLPDSFSDPTDGILMDTVEDVFEFGGFHKIKLGTPVQIQKGQYYSIVQTQTTPDGQYSVNMPIAMNEAFSKVMGNKTWVEGVVNKKESYMYIDGKWHDYSDKDFVESIFGGSLMMMAYDNFPIKGYSRMQPDISIRVNGDTTLNIFDGSESTLRVTFKGHDAHAVQPEAEWKLSEGGSEFFTVKQDPNDPFKAAVTALKVGTANLFVTVKGAGTTVIPLTVQKKELYGVMVDTEGEVYDGKAKTPPVYVYDEADEEVSPEHYTVKFSNNINCGSAKVEVKAKPDDTEYRGTQEIEFTIIPAKAVIKSMTDGKNKLTVTVADQKASGVTSYEVSYRVKGTSAWTTKSFSSSSNKLVLKKLKNGKKYQVKVCAIAPENEDTGLDNEGEYSAVKTSGKIGAVPGKPVIKKIKAGKSKLTITLKGKKPAAQKYKVQYRVKGTKKWKSRTLEVKSTKIVLKKLKKGKKYQVRVRLVKDKGLYSKYSKVKTGKKIK